MMLHVSEQFGECTLCFKSSDEALAGGRRRDIWKLERRCAANRSFRNVCAMHVREGEVVLAFQGKRTEKLSIDDWCLGRSTDVYVILVT